MRRQINSYGNDKISLSQLSNSVMVPYNQISIPNLPNHIYWSSNNENQNAKLKKNDESKQKSKGRRRIFDSFPAKRQSILDTANFKVPTQSHSKENSMNKKTDNKLFERRKDDTIQSQIQSINRQLYLHRSTVQNQRHSNIDTNVSRMDVQSKWIRIQQKITESQQLLKQQSQLLNTKIPMFQKQIEQTYSTVNQISKVLRIKQQFQDRKIVRSTLNASKSSSKLKIKEDQLLKVSSSLEKRANTFSNNIYEDKKKALELQQIRRVQQLQAKNLQLYNKLYKEKGQTKKYQFEDYVINKADERDSGGIWSDDEPRFQNQKISKIYYSSPTKDKQNCTYSPNNTITELLSPLALNDSKFML